MTLLLPLCLTGCIFLDYGLNPGPSRLESGGRGGNGESEEGPAAVPRADTSIYICAVQFDDSYEWQRDTAYGSEPYTILLFKNFEQVLSISSAGSTCTSPDHDTHHIIDGHLYTEYSGMSSTSIGKDGVEAVNFPGREFLKGLLPSGDDIYSLSQRRDGHGFSLRKNGQLLFSREEGTAFGGMNDPSYGPTGSLYLDGGQLCFCYWAGEGKLRRLYIVRDGMEEEIMVPDVSSVSDMKSIDGDVTVTDIDIYGYKPVGCSVWNMESGTVTAGLFSYGNTYRYGIYYAGSQELIHVSYQETTLYLSEEGWFAIAEKDGGAIEFCNSAYERTTDDGCYFLSPACADPCGKELAYGLSSRSSGGRPKVRIGEKSRELEVHGFISRVAVEINPAS